MTSPLELRTPTPLQRAQILGFWGAGLGWTFDGMDSFFYALVMTPALTELLPKSGYAATPPNIGLWASMLFGVFVVGWGCAFVWGPLANLCLWRPRAQPARARLTRGRFWRLSRPTDTVSVVQQLARECAR